LSANEKFDAATSRATADEAVVKARVGIAAETFGNS
jgi:hypothetical protein